jgi:hypothetical protein
VAFAPRQRKKWGKEWGLVASDAWERRGGGVGRQGARPVRAGGVRQRPRGGRGRHTRVGGPVRWAGCRPAQCEQSYFLFIQTILNCPKFESTKWRTFQTKKYSNKIWF